MKKTLLTLTFLLALSAAQAQTEKGSFMLGASLGSGSTLHYEGQHTYNATINPDAGFFVKDNFALGIRAQASFYKFKNDDGSSSSSSSFYSFRPFARYYLPTENKAHFFGELSTGINLYSQGEVFTFAGSSIGVDYFITPNIAFESSVGLDVQLTGFNAVTYNPGIDLGFRFFLNRKNKKETAEGETTKQVSSTQKGTVMIGAGLANADKWYHDGLSSSTYYNLSANAGYFLAKDFEAGLRLAASKQDYSFHTLSAVAFGRYYLPKKESANQKLRFFGEGTVGLISNIYKNYLTDKTEIHNSFQGGAGIGANYFVTPHISMETSFNYRLQTFDSEVYHSQYLQIGFNIFLFKQK